MTKINTIIWDWNGTLLNDLECCVQIINKMLAKRNLKKITVKDYQSIFTFPAINYYKKIGFNFSQEDYHAVADEYMDLYNENTKNCSLHPDALLTIQQLAADGYQQVVLSAMEEKNLLRMLKHYKLTPYFSHIFGIHNFLAESKTQRAIELFKTLKIPAENLCLIGDTLHDLESAQAIKCKIILVSHGHHPTYRLKTKNIPIINSLKNLKSKLLLLETNG